MYAACMFDLDFLLPFMCLFSYAITQALASLARTHGTSAFNIILLTAAHACALVVTLSLFDMFLQEGYERDRADLVILTFQASWYIIDLICHFFFPHVPPKM